MKLSVLRYTALLAAMLLAGSLLASAQSAGYDLLQTGSGASVDLSSVSGVSPSTVNLKGVPICACIGTTDTIMHRTADVPSGGGAVPVNVYALFMKNSGSVTFNGSPIDVYVTINNTGTDIATSALPQPDALTESTGTVTVRTDGTFDSDITVHADIIFTQVGGNPANSSQVVAHQAAPQITLTSTNSTWSTTPSPGYPTAPCYPSGGFYPKPAHTGPHPVVPPSTPTPTPTPTPSPTPNPNPSPTPIHSLGNPTSSSSSLLKPELHDGSIFVWTTNPNVVSAAYNQKRTAALSASAVSVAPKSQRTCAARSQQPARPVPIAEVDRNRQPVGKVVNHEWTPAVANP